jgi:hypothetical protein
MIYKGDFVKRFQLGSIALISLTVVGCSFSADVKTGSNEDAQTTETSPNASSTTNRSVWTDSTGAVNSIVNERKTVAGKGVRYSSRSINGVETKLEAPVDVIFLKGKPVKWPANAVVSLSEKRIGVTQSGELRPDGAQMKIWMKRGNSFEPGTAEDQKWADRLLAVSNLDDTPEAEKKKEAAKYNLTDPQFAKNLAALQYTKDVTEVVSEKAKARALTAKEQIALIDLVFDKVHYDKDQKAILLQLIHRKDLSKEASKHLLDNLERIHYAADRKLIQRELFETK